MSTSPRSSPPAHPLIEAQVTENQFQQEADFIRAFCDTTPDLLLQLHADGTVLNINRLPEFKLLHDTADILQRNIDELLPPAQAQALHAAMECTLREQKPVQCEWMLPIDRKERHFEVRVACLRPDRVLVIVRDTTAHHEALEQLRDLPRSLFSAQEAERRRLAGDLHDEIGQDLTAILLAVNWARDGLPAESRTALDETEAALRALTCKIRRLAQDLHPTALDEFGLAAALSSLLARQTVSKPLE